MDEKTLLAMLRDLDRPSAPPPELEGEFLDELVPWLKAEPLRRTDLDASGGLASASRPGKRRLTLAGPLVAAAAFAVIVAVGAVGWWLSDRGDEDVIASSTTQPITTSSTDPATTPTTTAAPTSTTLPPASAENVVTLPAGWFPIDAAWDGDRYWIIAIDSPYSESGAAPREQARIFSIDGATGAVVTETDLDGAPTVIEANVVGVWVAGWSSGRITGLDPENGSVLAEIVLELPFDVGTGDNPRQFIPNDIEVGFGSLWVSTARGVLARIDWPSARLEAMIELPPPFPHEIVVTPGSVWVAADGRGAIRIDPATNQISGSVTAEELGHGSEAMGWDGDYLYIAGDRPATEPLDGGISRIDPQTGEILGNTTLDAFVVHLGWVNAFFGAIDANARFWGLGPRPELIGDASRTNWNASTVPVSIFRDTWMIDHRGGRLLRVDRLAGGIGDPTGIGYSDVSAPRPAPSGAEFSPDWTPLDPGPLGERWFAVLASAGDLIVGWGGQPAGGGAASFGDGAVFDTRSDAWRPMTRAPLSFTDANWAWTGEELVIWGSGGAPRAMAWTAETDVWRVIEDFPVSFSYYSRTVFYDGEILDLQRAVAYDVTTGGTRDLAAGPGFGERGSIVLDTSERPLAVAVPGPGVYDIEADEWIETNTSGLTPLATRAASTVLGVTAVDYEMRAATFDPKQLRWENLPQVPLRFYECFPSVHAVANTAVAELCSGYAVFSRVRESWLPVAVPTTGDGSPGTLLSTGTDLYWIGDGLLRMNSAVVVEASEVAADPRRVAVGNSVMQLEDGEAVTGSRSEFDTSTVDIRLANGESCTATAIHADAEAVIRSYAVTGTGLVDLPIFGSEDPTPALHVPAGAIDGLDHIVWATGTTDVVDIACRAPDDTLSLASRAWDRWS